MSGENREIRLLGESILIKITSLKNLPMSEPLSPLAKLVLGVFKDNPEMVLSVEDVSECLNLSESLAELGLVELRNYGIIVPNGYHRFFKLRR